MLILNQCFYPDVVATAQHGWDLALHLRKEGHEITAIASRSIYGAKGASLAKREVVQGVRIERVSASIFGKSSILARACDFLFFYILALWRALTLPKHDVCVVFTTPPFISLASWILRLIRGTRYVYWVMDLYPDVPVVCGVMRKDSLATRFFEGVNRFCLRRADRVVVLGRCMESLVLSKGIPASKLVRINVWSDQEEIKPIAREANAYRREWNVGDRLLVMYSGNFGIGHDIETMADGVTQLASDPRILFAFVGGGKRKPELIDILKSRGVTGFIDAPYQPRERLDELLSAADVQIQRDVTAAVRELLSASSVLLDANELTRSSHLIVERAPYQDEAGTKVYANGFENPQVFRLEVQAGQCRLIQLKTGQSRPLTHAKCTPVD